MDINMENDIDYSLEQRKKKYKKSNAEAPARKETADKGDELIYLSQIEPTDKDLLASFLSDREQCSESITNQEDDTGSVLDKIADLPLNENDTMIISEAEQILNDDYDDDVNSDDLDANKFIDELLGDNDCENSCTDQLPLHGFTSISTKSYCVQLLKLLRDANVCKSHTKRFISLIQSILPLPNNLPSTLDDLLSLLNIENFFIKRSVCLICKNDLGYHEKKCTKCQVEDKTMIADIYDVNIRKVLTSMLKRLSPSIEEYKEKRKNNIDDNETKDIPFGHLYRRLLEKHDAENIISLILHLDGIGLTRSTRLKMWLFSGSLVELPPLFRYQRHNMVLMSIWVGYVEPKPNIWLRSIVSELNYMKTQGIYFIFDRKEFQDERSEKCY
jgi:hypothetical protein